MPSEMFLHDHPEFPDLIKIVADQRKIDPYLAEKDYWIMHCLYGLKKAGYDFQLKGGTSLSKGYGIIHRFSEDLDLRIAPPEGVALRTSKNHDKEKDRQARKDYYDNLAATMRLPGIVKVERDAAFDGAPKYFSGGIRLYYKARFPSDGAAKDGILLEVGFDDVTPNAPRDIGSWALDFALEKGVGVINNKALQIACYDPGHTLVEKLQAIVTKFRRQQEPGAVFPPNMLRHYYDVFCLLQDARVQAFIGTEEYQRHKERRFPAADLQAPLGENEALLLSDPAIRALYQREYERRAGLYYQGQPAFEDVLAVIRENLGRL